MSKRIKRIIYFKGFIYSYLLFGLVLLGAIVLTYEKRGPDVNQLVLIILLFLLGITIIPLTFMITHFINSRRYKKHTDLLKKYKKDNSKRAAIKQSAIVASYEGTKAFTNTISIDSSVYSDVEIVTYNQRSEKSIFDWFFPKRYKSSKPQSRNHPHLVAK